MSLGSAAASLVGVLEPSGVNAKIRRGIGRRPLFWAAVSFCCGAKLSAFHNLVRVEPSAFPANIARLSDVRDASEFWLVKSISFGKQ
jgi:hypothetical protein